MKYILPIAALIAMTSCEKEIDFEYHDIPSQQVIEGLLTQEGASVRLTETVATDEPFPDKTVTDAIVVIKDLTTDESFNLLPDADGIFTDAQLRATTGHDYELTVSIGDDRYSSSCRAIAPTEIKSAEFNWIKMPYDDVAVLKVEFTANSDPNVSYWLRVFRNGEAYQWQAIGSRNEVNGRVTGMMMTSRRDIDQEDDATVLNDGDVVDIEVLPITRYMGEYLESLNNGDYNGFRMFSGSYCLGYFLAAPVSKTQIIYHPDDISYAE